MTWKKSFTVGAPVVLNGIEFKVAHIGKRGLALRKLGPAHHCRRGNAEREGIKTNLPPKTGGRAVNLAHCDEANQNRSSPPGGALCQCHAEFHVLGVGD